MREKERKSKGRKREGERKKGNEREGVARERERGRGQKTNDARLSLFFLYALIPVGVIREHCDLLSAERERIQPIKIDFTSHSIRPDVCASIIFQSAVTLVRHMMRKIIVEGEVKKYSKKITNKYQTT